MLGDSPVTIVFYCRRWSELVPSGWQEQIKQGQTTTFPECIAGHLANPYASNVLNYCNILDNYVDVFGLKNISLVSYNSVIEQGYDLASHFFKTFLGWPDYPVTDNVRPNASLASVDIEMIRVLNVLELMRYGKCGTEPRNRYLRAKRSLDLNAVVAAMESDLGTQFMNEDSLHLRPLHQAIYERYGSRLLAPRSARHLFFVPRRVQIGYVRQNYLMAAGVSEALSAIYTRLRHQAAN
jgi:hypothetical protein